METLSFRASEINEVTIYFNAYYEDESENISIDLTKNKIYLSSSAKDMEKNDLAHVVENYFKTLPVRYDELVVKNKPRKFIPSLATSLIVGILVSTIFFVLTKLNVLSFENTIYGKAISAGILVVLTILGGLGFPNQNQKLYKNIKFEKYYAGHDDDYNSIYKDDVAAYKNDCEICIGENTDMPQVRSKIESNFKRSKKMVLVESLIALVLLILFFVI